MKQQQPPESVSISNHPPRHRDETMKDLHAFAQDFKLVPMQNEHPPPLQGPPQVVEQVSTGTLGNIYICNVLLKYLYMILYMNGFNFLDTTHSTNASSE